ncbi:hypothetical protein [Corynebacterium lizhenjunii]|uniref:hypothetical protein n=1 Tax=Corynebacterium lizhenjunii TaxID=2709394 RepID=UPI0013EB3146|nr:hypothetical protein [Corynebacterium lizhenjunii]
MKGELTTLATVARLVARKQVLPQHAVAIPALRGWWHIPVAMTVASLIEVVAVELIVPWSVVRVLLLVVTLYSLVLLWGVFGARWVYPHYLDGPSQPNVAGEPNVADQANVADQPTVASEPLVAEQPRRALHLRYRGQEVLAVSAIGTVSHSRGFETEHIAFEGNTLNMGGDGTNLQIELMEPTTARIAEWPWQRAQCHQVSTVRIGVDAPDATMRQLARLVDRD